jgi:hypothetical protein
MRACKSRGFGLVVASRYNLVYWGAATKQISKLVRCPFCLEVGLGRHTRKWEFSETYQVFPFWGRLDDFCRSHLRYRVYWRSHCPILRPARSLVSESTQAPTRLEMVTTRIGSRQSFSLWLLNQCQRIGSRALHLFPIVVLPRAEWVRGFYYWLPS